jgi:hypothetical protein
VVSTRCGGVVWCGVVWCGVTLQPASGGVCGVMWRGGVVWRVWWAMLWCGVWGVWCGVAVTAAMSRSLTRG